MKITRKTGMKASVLCGLLGVGIASFVQDAKAQEEDDNYCERREEGGTGCITTTSAGQQGPCVFYAPNYGITYHAKWTCYYDNKDALERSDSYECWWRLNGGCCNDLDTDRSDCPTQQCFPHRTDCLGLP